MKTVYIVHAIDTEGPLYESLDAKFERIEDIFKIKIKKKTLNEYNKFIKKKFIKDGNEIKVSEVFNNHLNNYNDNWKKISSMVKELMTIKFRNQFKDSFNKNWKITWHTLDHVNYKNNPRKRDLGFHKIYNFYEKILNKNKKIGDDIQWHYHPISTFHDAHYCATSYFRKEGIYEILCRKIIDKKFFPSAFRAGFQAERPDSNWFLEQWIPFDITNMAVKNKKHFDKFLDFKLGRSGNWRNAPNDWSIYHPDRSDYQKKGDNKRWIGRALNPLNRIAPLTQEEVDRAFQKSNDENKPVLMGLASHDWRDIRHEIKYSYKLILNAKKKFPKVNFSFQTVTNGFRETLYKKNDIKKNKLKIKIINKLKVKNDHPHFFVEVKNGNIFGPQPFLAIKSTNGDYIYDNFDFIKKNVWAYSFHQDTIVLDKVKKIYIAANDKYGNTTIKNLKIN